MRALVILILLAGCTVGPEHAAPTPSVADSWSSPQDRSARRESLTQWWRRFGDPVLDELIAQASENNTDVAEAGARLRQARESAVQAGAALAPTIDLSVTGQRSRSFLGTSSGGANAAGGNYITNNSFAIGFDASYEFDVFGGRRRGVQRAEASAEAYAADAADTLLSVQGEVARYFAEARGYQARLALARRTVALRQDSAALARARSQAGTGAELDAVQAQAEVENARAALPPLEQSLRAALLRLAVLTDRTPAAIEATLATVRPVPSLAGSVSPDPPIVTLARRPDVRAAERRIAAATANIGVAEADRLPAISLAGSIGLNSSRLSSVTRLSSNIWSLAPTIDLPIFDAGRRSSVVRERVAARDEAIAAWRGVVSTAVEEVEKSLTSLDRERAHATALQRTVAAYRDAVSLSTALWRAGTANYTDVVTAQRSLANAEDTLVQSRTALAENAIALFKAMGGGWGEEAR